ncbi:hypothetical protein [Shewanella sp.]|jgi:hypothetical protein|uniref:hypothetical protein n=1 Tax=Shewanella sp. TaxID=50422 RepID=UPI00356500E0
MKISEAYKWEAEKRDGTIITKGGNLQDCVRFSLLPQINLPKQDIIGIPMIRRFGRGFLRQNFQTTEMLPGFLHWQNGSNQIKTENDLTDIVTPGRLIKKRHDGEKWWLVIDVKPDLITILKPYDGKTKRIETRIYIVPPKPEYLHCVVCKGFRLYVKSSDGTVLITPENYELNL